MGLSEFVEKSRRKYRRRGLEAAPEIAGEFLLGAASRLVPIHRYGRRVFDHEWDVLVVLDGCRADMYRDVVNENAETAWSCGGTSTEWMRKNFAAPYADEMAETAYVCGNPFSEQMFTSADPELRDEFGLLDEVWKYAWDDELGTIPPGPLTDRAVAVGRQGRYDRTIVHYMQPHYPFVGSDDSWGWMDVENFGEGTGESVWQLVKRGELDLEPVREAYYDNLRFVWSHVETLLENTDGQVVVTADHGNSYGGFGVWGHRGYVPAPGLRRVPWDRREATDEGTYEPELTRPDVERVDASVADRLEELGYT